VTNAMEQEAKIGGSSNGVTERTMGLKCSICETGILFEEAKECPFCHELFCQNHIMTCEACGVDLCVDCMEYPEGEPICPTCAAMLLSQ